MNKIVVTGVMSSLLLALPALANHVPSINTDVQGIANKNDYKLGVVSAGAVMPIAEGDLGMLFADLRVSRSNVSVHGIHLGLGMRKEISGFTVGVNSFYDAYSADSQYAQYVGGVEAFNNKIKVRGTFYYPIKNDDDFKGIELEGGMKFTQIWLLAKPYYFFHKTKDSVKGIGVQAKFETLLFSMFNFYAGLGYQYDTYYRHQANVSVGMRIALGDNNNGKSLAIPPIERNMFIYGHGFAGDTDSKGSVSSKSLEEKLTQIHSLLEGKIKADPAKKTSIEAVEKQIEKIQKTVKGLKEGVLKKNSEAYLTTKIDALNQAVADDKDTKGIITSVNDKIIEVTQLDTAEKSLANQQSSIKEAATLAVNMKKGGDPSAYKALDKADDKKAFKAISDQTTQITDACDKAAAASTLSADNKKKTNNIKTDTKGAYDTMNTAFAAYNAAPTASTKVKKKDTPNLDILITKLHDETKAAQKSLKDIQGIIDTPTTESKK